MDKLKCKTVTFLSAVFMLSGCSSNGANKATSLYPVMENIGNGLSSAYATNVYDTNTITQNDIQPNTDAPVTNVPISLTAPLTIPSVASIATPRKLGEFTTSFGSPKTGRAANIKLAAQSINNKIIYPGEIFSYNDATGPTNRKNGYKLSKIFVKGQEKKGYGGGVCQTSSTLYNAAKAAGMEIVERHPHSKEVFYVTKGNDAAVTYGDIDLKFKNILSIPVKINAYTEGEQLTVAIEAM